MSFFYRSFRLYPWLHKNQQRKELLQKWSFCKFQRNSFSTHSVEREIFESKVKKPIYKLALAIGLTKTLGFSSLFQDGGATKSE